MHTKAGISSPCGCDGNRDECFKILKFEEHNSSMKINEHKKRRRPTSHFRFLIPNTKMHKNKITQLIYRLSI